MRKRQTFLLTILSEEDDDASFCGRVKVISSGKTCTFTNLEELREVIADEMVDPKSIRIGTLSERTRICCDPKD